MIRVWDPALRIFHWSLVGIVVSNQFFNEAGEIWHERLGYAACALIAFRVFWGFVGPETARFGHQFRAWPPRGQLFSRISRHLRGKELRGLMHPPAALIGMGLMLLVVLLLGLTGWMMSWDRFFGDEWLEESHEILGTVLLVIAGAHVLGVLRDSFLHRENLVASMVHGKKRPLE